MSGLQWFDGEWFNRGATQGSDTDPGVIALGFVKLPDSSSSTLDHDAEQLLQKAIDPLKGLNQDTVRKLFKVVGLLKK